MLCIQCDLKATHVSPARLCAGHWYDWFHEGYVEDGLLTQAEYDRDRQKFIESEACRNDKSQ